jgi:FkbM family methyltransferase
LLAPGLALKACKHGSFLFSLADTFIGKSLNLYGEWCEGELSLLAQLLAPGDVVIDAGANIGTHTVFFAKQVHPNGCVIAFEPQRVIYQLLAANLASNGLTNVDPRNEAIGEASGFVRVPVFDLNSPANFGAFSLVDDHQDAGQPVRLRKIDELTLDRCKLIKVDVEGMEPAVLRGGRETIRQRRPYLYIEASSVEPNKELFEEIFRLDYQAFWHISSYFNPTNFFNYPENVFAHFCPPANVLCIHRSLASIAHAFEPVLGNEDTWPQALSRIQTKS